MTANELRERLTDTHHDLEVEREENATLKERIEDLQALLQRARAALMNPVDDDGPRSWANVNAVDDIDAALARLTQKKTAAVTTA